MQYEIGQNIKIRHPKTFEVKNLTAIDGEHPVRNIIFICEIFFFAYNAISI